MFEFTNIFLKHVNNKKIKENTPHNRIDKLIKFLHNKFESNDSRIKEINEQLQIQQKTIDFIVNELEDLRDINKNN